jgi:hypothetical protein
VPSGTDVDLYSICLAPGGAIYAIGKWGVILKY